MTKNERHYYKLAIEHIEYIQQPHSSFDIKVVNIRVKKDVVLADVTLNYYEDGKKESYQDCEYRTNHVIAVINAIKQVCYECGESVKAGSGKFVNRIPSLDTYEERVEMGVEHPNGEYLCDECDEAIRENFKS